jgi:U3 small nucleolar ribonucleoprotein component|tara:strand:+ start:311 stop:505 length:195 start_codon:yes stop_codon:yes gene_type:complete
MAKEKKRKLTEQEKGTLRSAYRRAHAEKGIQRIRKQHRPGEIYARAGVRSVLTRTNTDPLFQKG